MSSDAIYIRCVLLVERQSPLVTSCEGSGWWKEGQVGTTATTNQTKTTRRSCSTYLHLSGVCVAINWSRQATISLYTCATAAQGGRMTACMMAKPSLLNICLRPEPR